ncbi:hypothetical protein [Salibacterium sp. K-3]
MKTFLTEEAVNSAGGGGRLYPGRSRRQRPACTGSMTRLPPMLAGPHWEER